MVIGSVIRSVLLPTTITGTGRVLSFQYVCNSRCHYSWYRCRFNHLVDILKRCATNYWKNTQYPTQQSSSRWWRCRRRNKTTDEAAHTLLDLEGEGKRNIRYLQCPKAQLFGFHPWSARPSDNCRILNELVCFDPKLPVGTYSSGNLSVQYEISMHVFPTAPSL